MGPPRRNPSHISTPKMPSTSSCQPPLSPDARQSSVPGKQPSLGMTPASRYQHNLKVLRRRDPSIVSIFDQFSHVCLYHHNGTKWEKQGYEGSMFLYERESYPPYGFYILNRMGMDDHIQRLYPEDSIGAHGSYLIIRSYPEYTDRRLALARAAQSNGTPHKFSDVYAIPDVDKLTAAEKGESTTIGLWMFATDSREPLIDIFTRLHSYIKKNQSYPQEFRYGPDRPPPSIPSSTAAVINAPPHSNGATQTPQAHPASPTSQSQPQHGQGHFQARHPSQTQTYTNGGASELDKLFAKIDPSPPATSTSSQVPSSTSNMTVASLFAALGGGDLLDTADHRASSSVSVPSFPSSSSTGLSLLDSIFASADPARPPTTQSTIVSTTAPMTIHTPAPTTNAPPQILNQDVISTLLGLPPSRTASAASTAWSTGAQSHPSSREGDNERGGSDGYSESSTVLDPDAEYDQELQAAGASAGRPLLADHGPSVTNGHGHGHHHRAHGAEHGRILGDVTPRAPINGFITPPFASRPPRFPNAPSLSHAARAAPPPQPESVQTQTPQQRQTVTPGTARPLVPFEPDSELWPYPRADGAQDAEADEILELDFADTRALSDPDAFRRAVQNGIGRGKGKKKGKKERAAEQVRLREEIERSWDVPGGSVEERLTSTASPSPSPCSSPEVRAVAAEVPRQQMNGVVSKVTHPGLERQQGVVPEAVKESVIAAVSTQRINAPMMERNEFVREVLTLIHTDKSFVDTLFREYTSRVG
ncbi:hypothetical protein FPV67DRAFT_1765394 [Lyophyllum atratum]|nr:hypothetical protein FPV67DRAFT_1765394 [Lyophyllum atratum]